MLYAFVLGMPHPERGEEVTAVLVPAQGRTIDPDALTAHAREQISGYKVPTRIEIWDEADVPWLGSGQARQAGHPGPARRLNAGGGAGGQNDPMDVNGLLVDAFGRIRDATHGAVEGCVRRPADLPRRIPTPTAIAWLVWHLTRIQDDHVAGVAGHRAAVDRGRVGRALRVAVRRLDATGYGHDRDEVAR